MAKAKPTEWAVDAMTGRQVMDFVLLVYHGSEEDMLKETDSREFRAGFRAGLQGVDAVAVSIGYELDDDLKAIIK